MDDEGLTAEQTEKVLQFQDLIGIDDMVTCRDILIRHQWDLEVAIQEQLNLREGRPSLYSSSEREPQVINDRYLQRIFVNNRDPVPPTGLTGFLGFIVNYVFNICYSTLSSVLTLVRDLLRGNERSKCPLSSIAVLIRQNVKTILMNFSFFFFFFFYIFSCYRSANRCTNFYTKLQRKISESSSFLSGHICSSVKRCQT